MDARNYYDQLTEAYCTYGHNRAFHYALWDADVHDWDAALDRSGELLVVNLSLSSEKEILDIGCGIGGFAVYCAKNFGIRVTGITTVEKHVGMACERAKKNGVEELCRFLVMDMDRMEEIPDKSYDLVVNQESFCYVLNKNSYLRQVLRILKPDGVWSAIIFSRVDRPFNKIERKLYDNVRKGFHIPEIWSGEKTDKTLSEIGFVHIRIQDITTITRPASKKMIRHCRAPLLAAKLGLAQWFFRNAPGSPENYVGHFSAGNAYSKGLLKGCFKHNLIRARKMP